MFNIFASIICTLLSIGCNIKEERTSCPSRLFLNMGDVSISSDDPLGLYVISENEIVHSEILDTLPVDDEILIDVPRMSVTLMAWNGGEGMTGTHGLVIPLGKSCPPVYMHRSFPDSEGETCRDTLSMRKNHCVLEIAFCQNDGRRYELEVRGNVSGYNSVGEPVEGPFLAEAATSADENCPKVILPRQRGGTIMLDVCDQDGKQRSYPLSDYIDATGYDWNAPDLADLKVTIDIVQTTVSLAVLGWDEEFFFDVVL